MFSWSILSHHSVLSLQIPFMEGLDAFREPENPSEAFQVALDVPTPLLRFVSPAIILRSSLTGIRNDSENFTT